MPGQKDIYLGHLPKERSLSIKNTRSGKIPAHQRFARHRQTQGRMAIVEKTFRMSPRKRFDVKKHRSQ